MEPKGFKSLIGMRVLLSPPKRQEYGIEISPELKEELDKEYAAKLDRLEVYAVGDAVERVVKGDVVYVPTEDLRRGTLIEVNGEQKLMVNSMAIAIVW